MNLGRERGIILPLHPWFTAGSVDIVFTHCAGGAPQTP
jgi:hypothetical protein